MKRGKSVKKSKDKRLSYGINGEKNGSANTEKKKTGGKNFPN